MVVSIQVVFDDWTMIYESYSLLTTLHWDTYYILHAQQKIMIPSF
jgi:hypothetical protein